MDKTLHAFMRSPNLDMKLTTVQRESFEHLTLDNCHWYSFLRLAWFCYLLVLLCSFYLSIKNQFLSELILAVFTVFVISKNQSCGPISSYHGGTSCKFCYSKCQKTKITNRSFDSSRKNCHT
ncbi:hypothetical protein MTP99_001362 [Tenebrio molitor]|nr:hypothetical protein MTP99_001362 [Tenebrio molitor]